ncbi:tRNA uridine-5-carboxymethylaminomethyl(34) synthesis GTPase MnmE [Tissierella sp.]|uniref:tRNA uridine-5-carboxymethylaminomethyl(34) synthesis GTPase MnmE n=1 Tax=Tissierella sp. TaxID=41274 RepID=UPI00285764A4|nr:tRNA uridine-5-carboxymethylaminomethyl(34) synthesis GTPase MnmE [Tissierella sp.]MDR7854969.1 tRNA uridine-5-carboxymethylaminomethyl(34) synthesis GTPase MnmE [Tissierella sp.]
MTIAAISTAVGEAGIGIVRISGKKALDIGNSVFKGNKITEINEENNRKLIYGHIIDKKNDYIIDEVLISFMKGPTTYTREDMVEIYCHGGIISVRRVLELILNNGARLAEPGEFTKRAFLNGRLDLSQAEAVMDMIKAKTDKSFEVSLDQLEGSLSRKIKEIRNILLEMIAHIEVSIDFPDEDTEEMTYDDLKRNGNIVREEIEKLLLTSDRGKILRDALNTVILGKPNVGKSSLLNSILGDNRAIVTDIPGTTRDIIEEYVNIDGIPLRIIDTAGIRNTEDLVEQIGVNKAKESVEKADLIIVVFDASRELSEEDHEIIKLIQGKKSIILLNKVDLMPKYDIEHLKSLLDGQEIITTSITSGIGVDLLENSIKSLFFAGDVEINSNVIITNMRHKNQLVKALENINQGIEELNGNVPIDCVEVELKNCWDNLGEISGDTIGEDILDKIFSEFCIGK